MSSGRWVIVPAEGCLEKLYYVAAAARLGYLRNCITDVICTYLTSTSPARPPLPLPPTTPTTANRFPPQNDCFKVLHRQSLNNPQTRRRRARPWTQR